MRVSMQRRLEESIKLDYSLPADAVARPKAERLERFTFVIRVFWIVVVPSFGGELLRFGEVRRRAEAGILEKTHGCLVARLSVSRPPTLSSKRLTLPGSHSPKILAPSEGVIRG